MFLLYSVIQIAAPNRNACLYIGPNVSDYLIDARQDRHRKSFTSIAIVQNRDPSTSIESAAQACLADAILHLHDTDTLFLVRVAVQIAALKRDSFRYNGERSYYFVNTRQDCLRKSCTIVAVMQDRDDDLEALGGTTLTPEEIAANEAAALSAWGAATQEGEGTEALRQSARARTP